MRATQSNREQESVIAITNSSMDDLKGVLLA
jgi:hypothetical protein